MLRLFSTRIFVVVLLLAVHADLALANNKNQLNRSTSYVPGTSSIQTYISDLIATRGREYNIGILIQDAKTGKVIYAANEEKLFTPASTTKLFPAAAALIELGEDFSFETAMYADRHKVTANTVNNLYLKFSGDPELTSSKLISLIGSLKEKNIIAINGNIVIDGSIFSGPDFGAGWSWESNQWSYSPPITAAMINSNSVNLDISKSETIGSHLPAKFLDSNTSLKVLSTVKAVTYEDSKEKCRLVIDATPNNHYFLSGCWPVSVEPGVIKLAIKNPENYIKDLVLSTLKTQGVRFNGRVVSASTPSDGSVVKIAAVNSNKLDKIVKRMLNKSDNVYTESITKTLGAKLFKAGSFKTGVSAIKRTLNQNLGVNVASLRIEDGSGLSRYNLISPKAFNELLYKIYNDKNYYSFMSTAMRWPQECKYLQSRVGMLDYKAPITIRAKTGTLSGVSSVSGYLTTKNKRDLIFTIMINGIKEKQRVAKNIENKILTALMEL